MSLTAPLTLNVATPRALATGLALLGFDWSFRVFEKIQGQDDGLYAWVPGSPNYQGDPLNGPVLYIGVGTGPTGVRGRLLNEIRWANDYPNGEVEYLFTRTMYQQDARPVGGTVHHRRDADLSWLAGTISPEGEEIIRSWLAASEPSPVEKAEAVAIRAAAWLGETAPPVNCQYTTAWESNDPWDWGGWAVALHLK